MGISKINSQITLEYLQSKDENQYFERKGLGEKDIKPTKIADELIGMLNADGGILAFGVSDKGEIQDLNELEKEKLNKYRTLMNDFIKPFGHIELEEVFIENKLLFIYHVEQDIECIYSRKDNENVFLRVHDTNRLLNLDDIKTLEYNKQIRRFEDKYQSDFDLEDLDMPILEKYREKLNYEGTVLDLLTKRHLATKQDGEYKIKKAAVLLFAKDPEKYISSASLRYVRYEGNEEKVGLEHNVIKDQRFETNIPRIIGNVKAFLKAALRDYYYLDIASGRFNKVQEYPEEAWLEGVVNALCHRSYNIQGNPILIKHFNNRFEISNSGPLPAMVTVENIRNERFARNPRLARVLEDMGFVRQLNEGVSRIFLSMEKSMLSDPEYKVVHDIVYLTLHNKISDNSKSIPASILHKIESSWSEYNNTQQKIIEYLFNNSEAILDDFVQAADVQERTVRRYLNQFINTDKIIIRLSEKERDKSAIYTLRKI